MIETYLRFMREVTRCRNNSAIQDWQAENVIAADLLQEKLSIICQLAIRLRDMGDRSCRFPNAAEILTRKIRHILSLAGRILSAENGILRAT